MMQDDFIEVRWDNPRAGRFKGWERTGFYSRTAGTVYLPIEPLLGTPGVLCAAYDGVPLIFHKQHAFAPVQWLQNGAGLDLAEIERKVIEAAGKD